MNLRNIVSRRSSVCVVIRPRAGRLENRCSIPDMSGSSFSSPKLLGRSGNYMYVCVCIYIYIYICLLAVADFGIKRQECEADHSALPNADDKDMWKYACTNTTPSHPPPAVCFMAFKGASLPLLRNIISLILYIFIGINRSKVL